MTGRIVMPLAGTERHAARLSPGQDAALASQPVNQRRPHTGTGHS